MKSLVAIRTKFSIIFGTDDKEFHCKVERICVTNSIHLNSGIWIHNRVKARDHATQFGWCRAECLVNKSLASDHSCSMTLTSASTVERRDENILSLAKQLRIWLTLCTQGSRSSHIIGKDRGGDANPSMTLFFSVCFSAQMDVSLWETQTSAPRIAEKHMRSGEAQPFCSHDTNYGI